mgnify:CR=1 FL=1
MTRKLDRFNITDAKRGAAFAVRIVTRAQRNEMAGIQEDGTLKIRLTAAPVDDQANIALIKFLAERLGVAENQIEKAPMMRFAGRKASPTWSGL